MNSGDCAAKGVRTRPNIPEEFPSMTSLSVVITTIQSPTPSVRALADRLAGTGAEILIIGDRKGPAVYDLQGTRLVTIEEQAESSFALAPLLPENHYGRKNLGYLMAHREGAPCIYETDDDNAPGPTWIERSERLPLADLEQACAAVATSTDVPADRWLNVFRLFCDPPIWPRGFPLDLVHEEVATTPGVGAGETVAPIQQGLVDGEPDVDALWRLLMPRTVDFQVRPSVVVPPGAWCPFNSQSTWWWPSAYALMYLPCYSSFRMTDIWRSFVAQRCLWELGHGVVFHAPEVVQERNPHDLMRDFRDEVPGYEGNRAIVRALADLNLDAGESSVADNVMRCYERLVADGFLPADELPLVRAWVQDVQAD